MTYQTTLFRVFGLDRVITQLPEFADVVQDRRGDDHALVERRIEIVVIARVMIDQQRSHLGHAPDMLEQARRVTVVHLLSRRHPGEGFSVLGQNRLHQLAQVGFDNVLLDPRRIDSMSWSAS